MKKLDFNEEIQYNALKECTNTMKRAGEQLNKSNDLWDKRKLSDQYNVLKEFFSKHEQTTNRLKKDSKDCSSHFSGITAESELPFEYLGSFGPKQSSQIHLVTEGSENINEDTDVCLKANMSKSKHKKSVSFKEDKQMPRPSSIYGSEIDMRPQSTTSNFSIADEHFVYEENNNQNPSNANDSIDVNKWAGDQKLDSSMIVTEKFNIKDWVDFFSQATLGSCVDENNENSEYVLSSSK